MQNLVVLVLENAGVRLVKSNIETDIVVIDIDAMKHAKSEFTNKFMTDKEIAQQITPLLTIPELKEIDYSFIGDGYSEDVKLKSVLD
jgi:hypothetical protein